MGGRPGPGRSCRPANPSAPKPPHPLETVGATQLRPGADLPSRQALSCRQAGLSPFGQPALTHILRLAYCSSVSSNWLRGRPIGASLLGHHYCTTLLKRRPLSKPSVRDTSLLRLRNGVIAASTWQPQISAHIASLPDVDRPAAALKSLPVAVAGSWFAQLSSAGAAGPGCWL